MKNCLLAFLALFLSVSSVAQVVETEDISQYFEETSSKNPLLIKMDVGGVFFGETNFYLEKCLNRSLSIELGGGHIRNSNFLDFFGGRTIAQRADYVSSGYIASVGLKYFQFGDAPDMVAYGLVYNFKRYNTSDTPIIIKQLMITGSFSFYVSDKLILELGGRYGMQKSNDYGQSNGLTASPEYLVKAFAIEGFIKLGYQL